MANVSHRWLKDVAQGFVTGTMKVLLVGPTYSFSASHSVVDDIVPGSNEVSDPSYSRQTLTAKVATQDDILRRGLFDCDDVVWTGLDAGSIEGAWIYEEVTDDGDSPLRIWSGFSRTSNGGVFTLRINTQGLFEVVEG